MSRTALLNAHTAIMEGEKAPISIVKENDDSPRSALSRDVSTPGSEINNSITQMFGDAMVSLQQTLFFARV
jgi:hypothetical protein